MKDLKERLEKIINEEGELVKKIQSDKKYYKGYKEIFEIDYLRLLNICFEVVREDGLNLDNITAVFAIAELMIEELKE